MTAPAPHLWLTLTPHGYGHAVMTAPLVAELRRRRPGLRLTIQTELPRAFLATRYGSDFELVDSIPDFGMVMTSAVGVDVPASAAAYARLAARWPDLVAAEAARLARARPDLVLANVPPLSLAAAAAAGIPSVAFSCLNWYDLYRHYCGDRPEAPAVLARLGEAYGAARLFLRCAPAMAMTLPNCHDVGPVAALGRRRGRELRTKLRMPAETRVGLLAFGGIDYRLDLTRWPAVPGWVWVSALNEAPPVRPDMAAWQETGIPFADLIASVDLVVTKPGYGTYTEVALAGIPVLAVPRPGWPESEPFNAWLAGHTRCLEVAPERLTSPELPALLDTLFAQNPRPAAAPTGVAEAADAVDRILMGVA